MSTDDCPLAIAANLWPDRPAIESRGRTIRFNELDLTVTRLANQWRSQGWRPGNSVGLRGQTDIPFAVTLWSLLRNRITPCIVSPRWPQAEIERTGSSLKWSMWIDDSYQQSMTELGKVPAESNIDQLHRTHAPQATSSAPTSELAIRIVGCAVDSTRADKKGDSAGLASIDDPCFQPELVLFSSGSTGQHRAICHKLDAHLASARAVNAHAQVNPNDRWLLSLSTAHVGGLAILFRCMLAGACCVVPGPHHHWLDAMLEVRPTLASLVPVQLHRLLDRCSRPWPELRGLYIGGAPCPQAWLEQGLQAGWPLITTYGLTEMASQVTTSRLPPSLDHDGHSGVPLTHCEVRIGPNQEIFVRGASQFLGYWRDGQLHRPFDAEGWFATGDRGAISLDGHIHVTGRLDNQFISGGENIYPEEIELAMIELLGVHQAVVVPIAHASYGHRPIAFVEATPFAPDTWRQVLQERLPRFKIPDQFWPLPPGHVPKPRRAILKTLAEERIHERNAASSIQVPPTDETT